MSEVKAEIKAKKIVITSNYNKEFMQQTKTSVIFITNYK